MTVIMPKPKKPKKPTVTLAQVLAWIDTAGDAELRELARRVELRARAFREPEGSA